MLASRRQTSSGIQKTKSKAQIYNNYKKQSGGEGHLTKFSSDAYKSAKGKGDVLKAGKLEPFSYIQLNPRLLNKRHKQKAIKSFSKVVSFGKKLDKRSNSMMAGMQIKGNK